MDQTRYSFFIEQYRAMSPDELAELSDRRTTLTMEAARALDDVLGRPHSDGAQATHVRASASSPGALDDSREQSRLSKELWNSPGAYLCAGQFLMSFAAFPQVFRLGVVGLVLAGWAGFWVGRRVTRSICASDEKSIAEKRSELKSLSMWMWAVLILSHVLANTLARS